MAFLPGLSKVYSSRPSLSYQTKITCKQRDAFAPLERQRKAGRCLLTEAEAHQRYIKAVNKGILKVMAKTVKRPEISLTMGA